MKLIDTQNLVTPKSDEKIFFGKYSSFQRYDNPIFKFTVDMEEKQRNAFWNPKEISMQNDAQKFYEMPKEMQEVMYYMKQQKSGDEYVCASCT